MATFFGTVLLTLLVKFGWYYAFAFNYFSAQHSFWPMRAIICYSLERLNYKLIKNSKLINTFGFRKRFLFKCL